jgi:plastocyanin
VPNDTPRKENRTMAVRKHLYLRTSARRAVLAGSAVLALLAVPASLLAAGEGPLDPPQQVAKVEGPTVTIDNFSFTPANLSVPVGTTVTWTNQDDMVHTVTSSTRAFSSTGLETGQAFSYAFTTPGTYTYFCSFHPKMTATVIVR